MVTDVGETWYAKPQSGKMMVSSADATPVDPHDAYADDMAIAEGIERLMNATTIEVNNLHHSWGGLRTFAPDGAPVIGFDPSTGRILLARRPGRLRHPVRSRPLRTAAAMVLGEKPPQDVRDAGLVLAEILPDRF